MAQFFLLAKPIPMLVITIHQITTYMSRMGGMCKTSSILLTYNVGTSFLYGEVDGSVSTVLQRV